MTVDFVTVYDQDGALLAILDNASNVGYELHHNDLWTGSFDMPSDDPKNIYCQAHNLVRLPDGDRDVGLYRIIGSPNGEQTAQGGTITYSVEHAMATLLDDILFGYHEIGGEGIPTVDVIRYILDQQTTARWQLGRCEFDDEFAYKFENTSLLSALLSLGEVLLPDSYTWDFDTSTTPWTVNLCQADSTPGCGMHYARNLVGIDKTMDATTLVTRLYPLGYGEGVNQLTIRDVNGGVPYIDADTIGIWRTKAAPFVDTRIEDAATLKARAEAVLEGLKNPYISYTASAIDLYRVTGQSWDKYMPGKLVHVMDSEHGIDFSARLVIVSKTDTQGDPGAIQLTIANAARDTADSINTLADRVGIGELYSQGATNLFAVPFADNADTDHPATMRIYIPHGLVRINQMLLSWRLAAFRAYETGAKAGGGTTVTSSSGGQATETSSSTEDVTYTSETQGEYSVTLPTRAAIPRAQVGRATGTDGSGSIAQISGGSGTTGEGGSSTTGEGGGGSTAQGGNVTTEKEGSHTHVGGAHTHGYSSGISGGSISGVTDSGGGVSTGYSGAHDHTLPTHAHTLSEHTHSIPDHTHSIPSHSHNFQHHHAIAIEVEIPPLSINVPAHGHNVKIPGHSHKITTPNHSHSVTLKEHEHAITYGIYEGTTAHSVTVQVDGNAVPLEGKTSELDIVRYLAKDEAGKVTRGAWHEIKIIPDTLTRIEANLFAQAFVQSVGGGNY